MPGTRRLRRTGTCWLMPGVDISHALSDVVKGADVVAILTGHDKYSRLGRGAEGVISAGFVYKGIGSGDRNEHAMK